jgi:hypothetical protein
MSAMLQACPGSTVDNPHVLAENMHRHCPDREVPCKWVICGNAACRAVVQLPIGSGYFRGPAPSSR